MMKRFGAILLSIALLMAALPSALAVSVMTVSTETASAEDDIQIEAFAAVGDTAYVLRSDGTLERLDVPTRQYTAIGKSIFVGSIVDAEYVQRLISEAEDPTLPVLGRLFSDGQALYGLCIATGEWYTLLDAEGAYAPQKMDVKLDLKNFSIQDAEYMMPLELNSLFALGGYLYYSGNAYVSMGQTAMAGRVSLETGAATAFATENLYDLQPWKDGKLLARQFSYTNSMLLDGNMPGVQYGLLDPEKDAFEVLGEIKSEGAMGGMSISGFRGDPDTDTLYYFGGSRIMGLDIKTGETRISAYTGEGMFGGYNTATTSLAGSYYLRRTYEGLDIYALDTDAVKDGALRIFGEFGGETHRTFRTNYPDIPVEVADEYTSNLEALTNAMVSETDVYDVLLLDCTYMPVNRLMDKGYCLDLSGYPQLMEIAGQMNPKYLERMQRDGKLYGMPVQLSANDMAVNIRLWEDELGLSRDDLPKTFMELLEFIQNWEDDYADDFPDIMPLEQVTGKDYLYSMLLDRYMSYQQVQEGGLKFDTPLFKKLMAMADGISGEALSGGLEEGSMEYWNQPYLFTFYYPLSQFDYMRYQQDMEPLLLPMDEGLERLTPANMSVLIINPKSARIDQALLYVENYLKNLPAAGAAITLFPENNAPVVNPNYEKTMAEYQADIAKQEELLEKAEESEKANIRDSIKHMEQFRDEYQQSDQYDVGPEQIAFYREMVEPYVFVAQQSIYTGGNTSELGNVLQQFFQGAMSSDQFAKEMDNRLQMMRLEDE